MPFVIFASKNLKTYNYAGSNSKRIQKQSRTFLDCCKRGSVGDADLEIWKFQDSPHHRGGHSDGAYMSWTEAGETDGIRRDATQNYGGVPQ